MARKPISPSRRFEVLQRDGYACQCCGAQAPNATLHVDHIVPVSRGGSNAIDNLRALCVTCNISKSDSLAEKVVPIRQREQSPVCRMADLPHVAVRGEALSQPVYWLGLQWAVTSYGVEARDGTYAIEAGRLWEGEKGGFGWEQHMREKDWVDLSDLRAALVFAREHFSASRRSGNASQ